MATSSSFLRIAKIESQKSKQYHKMGCVIVKNGKVIGKGFNIRKTHPRFGSGNGTTLHAESSALVDAFGRVWSLEGCEAYIYRKGSLMARPCVHCMNYLKQAGIKKIHYTCEEEVVEEKI